MTKIKFSRGLMTVPAPLTLASTTLAMLPIRIFLARGGVPSEEIFKPNDK